MINKTGETKMKNGDKVWVLQTDKDDECWVAGTLIKKTAKRFLVRNHLREITRYYAHCEPRTKVLHTEIDKEWA
jgi:hypothetical protein